LTSECYKHGSHHPQISAKISHRKHVVREVLLLPLSEHSHLQDDHRHERSHPAVLELLGLPLLQGDAAEVPYVFLHHHEHIQALEACAHEGHHVVGGDA